MFEPLVKARSNQGVPSNVYSKHAVAVRNCLEVPNVHANLRQK